MANEKSDQCLAAQLPRLEDNNFEFWMQSLTLIACGLAIHEYLEKDINPDELNGSGRRLYYLLLSADVLMMWCLLLTTSATCWQKITEV